MDQRVLSGNQTTHVTVPKDIWVNIVRKRIFVLAVHVQILENARTICPIFHAVVLIILWDQHVKRTTTVLGSHVVDMEPVLYKVMATIVIAPEDTVARTVKSYITALGKIVTIMEDVSK